VVATAEAARRVEAERAEAAGRVRAEAVRAEAGPEAKRAMAERVASALLATLIRAPALRWSPAASFHTARTSA
jgi:hypothetical protein